MPLSLRLIAVGKCRDKAILSLVAEYQKRLQHLWPLEIIEVPASTSAQEAEALLAKCRPGAIIALDERGKQPSSTEFAAKIGQFEDAGHSMLNLLIGGADGHPPELRAKADYVLSLSNLTLPHMLVRPVLAEQLYRAATIRSGHPYHREG